MDYKKTVEMLAHRLEQQKKVIEESLEDNMTLNEALMLLGQLYQDHSGVLFGLKAAGISGDSQCCGSDECCKKVSLPAEDDEDDDDADFREVLESLLGVLAREAEDKAEQPAEESEEEQAEEEDDAMAVEAYLLDTLTKRLSRICPSIQIHEFKVRKKD